MSFSAKFEQPSIAPRPPFGKRPGAPSSGSGDRTGAPPPALGPGAGGSPSGLSIAYKPQPGLLWLSIKNALLTIVTLTIYRFWAKTAVRRHVWSCVHINGEPVEYTGLGTELFLGALIITGVVGVPSIAILSAASFYFGQDHLVTIAAKVLLVVVFLALTGMAIYRARRYRLSRTLWRGIRGSLTGSPTSFSLLYFGALILQSLTLGWSSPAMNLNIQKRLIGDMQFGSSPFEMDGEAGPLYSRYTLCWFLAPVAAVLAAIAVALVGSTWWGIGMDRLTSVFYQQAVNGPLAFASAVQIFATVIAIYAAYSIVWTFYTAREMAVFAGYTSFDQAKFRLDATGASLMRLWLGNMAIIILTIGIGRPFVMQRSAKYLCDRLSVSGNVDIGAIQQSSAAMDERGEGLASYFDIDAF